ncbi:MAG: symmetrical bis(5'-nucleosyl)-tetraphosphatase, partial [Methylotenera sp.]
CYQHRDAITGVLGNHDLHALVVAAGIVNAHRGDTLDEILAAEDRAQLLYWLRMQKLMHYEHGYLMVHAGLLPQWTAQQALTYAAEVETVLHSDDYLDFFKHMYGNLPDHWQEDLQGVDRLRVITNAATRLRICAENGQMEFKFKGELEDIPAGFMPWFDVPQRASRDTPVIFGHWSALGLQQRDNIYALDTGCLWGGKLTAMNLETKAITQVDSQPADKPI